VQTPIRDPFHARLFGRVFGQEGLGLLGFSWLRSGHACRAATTGLTSTLAMALIPSSTGGKRASSIPLRTPKHRRPSAQRGIQSLIWVDVAHDCPNPTGATLQRPIQLPVRLPVASPVWHRRCPSRRTSPSSGSTSGLGRTLILDGPVFGGWVNGQWNVSPTFLAA
jgi:hypothetical protein